MAHIDYYFGTPSPWAYLAGNRLEEIAARHNATITYKPVDLLQLFDRTGGVRPANRPPARMEMRAQELRRWSAQLGMKLDLNPAFWPVNPAPSSYAVIAAQEAGGGDLAGLVQSFMHAVWADEENIADDAVIRAKLAAAGFDPALADKGLFVGAETFGRNLEQAVTAGVFGAPFYIVRESDERFWGQDRLEFLDRYLGTL